ncbi:SMR domain-containing protein [Colletotrichum tofieldiae]|uniref:SMR domain-containing protein n=1 Tax=Colletotrichum tofieldiae TaxID=708197 RepID=A0A166NW36_9PEZI|nr:SMR domain-containing protein [Colletotrichum tofieldiae]GKT53797.1 SMR domain-containing protein [Colletotrichum tofieldiae]GKT73535.1 SMR domain-containing protein [Colletotrichum tofieldiae]GKT95480.1 SMR domain-containing protein [Colletotrichum tofieldiae]
MSIPMNRLGGRAFSHANDDDDDVEREYDRLRDAAREEANKRNQCFERSQQAYQSGDGAAAKELSNEGKRHAQRMEDLNRQASEYIFRENNAAGRVTGSCVDLHGQFVEEAERILEERIRADRARGQDHLHAIVGKGNHSTGHVQKLKPRIEEICREMGLNYSTEENAGRIYINLQGGDATMPPPPQVGGGHHGGQQHGGQQHGGQHQQPHHGGQTHGGQQHHGGQHHGGQHQQPQQDESGDLVVKILKKLEKACCIVM